MAKQQGNDQPAREGMLGDITPSPEKGAAGMSREADHPHEGDLEHSEGAMSGGSQHDRTRHPGSRDVTEGTTGGTGVETGGTRNYRQGSGATGTDIGNRPE
jgi:hypothetical protein